MNQISAYAFDVYGTLIDTNGVLDKLREYTEDQAEGISTVWRAKQLEYSFRRGLMQQYVPFPEITAQALDYALTAHKVNLSIADRQDIASAYAYLPAFPDAKAALEQLKDGPTALFAFSNGPQAVVTALLEQAEILPYFKQVVSVETTQVFKPSPVVYQHFAATAQRPIQECALVSGNPFDVLGAKGAGMQGIWAKRSPQAVFDTWAVAPDRTISSLLELVR